MQAGLKTGQVDYRGFPISNPELRRRLEIFAEQIGRRMIITSGDRTPERNKEVGGKKRSFHLARRAADFKVEGMEMRKVARLAADATLPNGEPLFPGVGFEYNHVHVDIRPGPRVRFIRDPKTGKTWVVPGF